MIERKNLQHIFYNIKKKQKKYSGTEYEFNVDFDNSEELINWYIKQNEEQKEECCYCHSKQADISKLIDRKLIKSKRITTRGNNLEIERKEPNGPYSPANCALACYFCNNDKSDVISDKDYIKYFASKKKNYIDDLLKQL